MVCPPAFIAATPVGARTTYFNFVFSTKYFRNVDFPVPAFPVINTFLRSSISSFASLN